MVELYVKLILLGSRSIDSIKDEKMKDAVIRRLYELGYDETGTKHNKNGGMEE